MAGRPRLGRIQLTLTLAPDVVATLRHAQDQGATMSSVVDAAVRAYARKLIDGKPCARLGSPSLRHTVAPGDGTRIASTPTPSSCRGIAPTPGAPSLPTR
jgi:hypothetical protein